ncbi:MAG TPA: glutamine--fructose-6-phosphate transaminase (isomerizing) [Nitrososphaerales archaeon]|nr:glutamine--fructose-6-phosphate transaminase (isomerizing) [Nitrososphaerales archaeon]
MSTRSFSLANAIGPSTIHKWIGMVDRLQDTDSAYLAELALHGRARGATVVITAPPDPSFVCGIIGCVSDEPVTKTILDGLRRVEYRGYDSAGLATIDGGEMEVRKGVGRLQEIEAKVKLSELTGSVGMGHTRWATHGGVTVPNAHPQESCGEQVALVHNGIIENYSQLKKKLLAGGHVFKSETDTEVIVHLIEQAYRRTKDPVKATSSAVKKLKGQYAIVVLFRDRPDVLVGARKDAPLMIGVGDGQMFIASDVLAFIEHTDQTIFLDNLEVVKLNKEGAEIYNSAGRRVNRKATQVAWELSEISKEDYAHYTRKEIDEQPRTVASAALQDDTLVAEFARRIRSAESIFVVAAGSSFHAGLLLKHRLYREAKIRCDATLAGEFRENQDWVGRDSVMVVISQSGETADVLDAVKLAKKKGAKILSIVNAAGSALARESDTVLLLNCGPEVGVAATKSFTAQVMVVNRVVDAVLGKKRTDGIKELSRAVQGALSTESQVVELAKKYKDRPDFYFVAKGFHYPVALEGALKLKELSYVHAEGMPASELKHGTLALIERGTPVVVINPSGENHDDTLSSAEELKARGARVIGISDVEDAVYTHFIKVPKVEPQMMPIVEAIPLQLIAYHFAVARKNDPDYPRNLAKSVTVK